MFAKKRFPKCRRKFVKGTMEKLVIGSGNSLARCNFPSHKNNKQVSQMRAPLAACREPAGDQNRPVKMPYVFEHKT